MTPRGLRLHPAVRGFEGAAEKYERARPGYPAPAVRALANALGLGPRRTVVELACGTGKLTRALRPTGATIVGIEPVAGMRAVFERTVPGVAVVPGTAEAIPLPDGFADAVVAAQAFHWFRPREALAEIARVLRPGGRLGLAWNTRDDSVPYSRHISEIVERYQGSAPRAREAAWQGAFERADGPFGPLHHRRFHHLQHLGPVAAVDRVLSVSWIASLPPSEQRRVAGEVRAFLAQDPSVRRRRTVDLPYRTDVYWARRR